MRIPLRLILVAWAALALALVSCKKSGGGSGGAGGASSSSSSGETKGRETVATLEKVKVTRILPTDVLSVEAFVSPDGSRYAVKRNVSERMNVQLYNVEVDGVPAPQSFDNVSGPKWSGNGKSFVYVGQNYKGIQKTPGVWFVHEQRVYGPFVDAESWRAMGVSPDGTTSCVVYKVVDRDKNKVTVTSFVNGTAKELAFEPNDVRFGPGNVPVYRKRGGTAGEVEEWVDADDTPVAQPPPDPETPRAVPAFAVTMKQQRGQSKKEPKRAVLTVNNQPAGDFDAVLSYGGRPFGPNYPQQFGFQQPDGRVFVYVMDGNRLVRLWFR